MCLLLDNFFIVFFKQKTAYEMRISDWSSDVCSSDLVLRPAGRQRSARPPNISMFPRQLPSVSTSPSAGAPGSSTTGSSSIGYRSEEHTSELQSLMRISYAVFCLKKKTLSTLDTRKKYHMRIIDRRKKE